ncbi:HDOD domain-containing protein [Massilia sp. 9096]|uniref:HDOD domain-containing protein n=1 Tax=Massilia sp. 9096 TaxID=1500894 RepID=UPI00055CBB68|nr:HDOD domain-containing protein [Massilia sp. 9096]
MKNWIARLLGGAGEPAPTPAPAPEPAAAPGAAAAATAHSASGAEDPAGLPFWRWLCDAPTASAASQAETPAAAGLVLDELARLARAPGDAADLVPRVPEVIPRLLRSLRQEGVSGAELARQVTQDAVLVAEVIREANGPLYRQAKPVRTVDAAILVLGQNGLRMLLARVAFRPVMGVASGRVARTAAPRLWQHSERCARACALLAPRLGADPFEGYLAGLMIDVGLVVALRLLDRLEASTGGPGPDPALLDTLAPGARRLSARIALHWELPPPIAAAILQAGHEDEPATPLAQALAQADRLARLRLLFDHGVLAADAAPLAGLDAHAAQVFERLAPDPA